MNLSLTLLTFLRSFTWLHPERVEEPAPIDLVRMIQVLIEVEVGKWDDQGGAAHMMHETWGGYSTLSYQLARHEEFAVPIYRLHLKKLARQIQDYGAAVTPENVAIAWRRGFRKACELNFQDEYGRRAANLWGDPSFRSEGK